MQRKAQLGAAARPCAEFPVPGSPNGPAYDRVGLRAAAAPGKRLRKRYAKDLFTNRWVTALALRGDPTGAHLHVEHARRKRSETYQRNDAAT